MKKNIIFTIIKTDFTKTEHSKAIEGEGHKINLDIHYDKIRTVDQKVSEIPFSTKYIFNHKLGQFYFEGVTTFEHENWYNMEYVIF